MPVWRETSAIVRPAEAVSMERVLPFAYLGQCPRRVCLMRPEGDTAGPSLNGECRTDDDLVELPGILVEPAKEIHRNFVMGFDCDRFLRSLEGQIILGDGDIQLSSLSEDFFLELVEVLDGTEARLLLHEVVKLRRPNFDRDDLNQAIADENQDH